MYVCTCVRVYVCTCVRVYVCTCVRVYVCTCVRVYVCTCVRVEGGGRERRERRQTTWTHQGVSREGNPFALSPPRPPPPQGCIYGLTSHFGSHLGVEGLELDGEQELLLWVRGGAQEGGVQGVQLATGLHEQAVGGARVGDAALGHQGLAPVEVLQGGREGGTHGVS